MKKKIFSISVLAILACATESFAQSSSEIDKSQSGTTVTPPQDLNSAQTITDSRIPSSLQFLIGLCEVKNGVYFMPRTKFAALTEYEQNYVLNNNSLFVIKD